MELEFDWTVLFCMVSGYASHEDFFSASVVCTLHQSTSWQDFAQIWHRYREKYNQNYVCKQLTIGFEHPVAWSVDPLIDCKHDCFVANSVPKSICIAGHEVVFSGWSRLGAKLVHVQLYQKTNTITDQDSLCSVCVTHWWWAWRSIPTSLTQLPDVVMTKHLLFDETIKRCWIETWCKTRVRWIVENMKGSIDRQGVRCVYVCTDVGRCWSRYRITLFVSSPTWVALVKIKDSSNQTTPTQWDVHQINRFMMPWDSVFRESTPSISVVLVDFSKWVCLSLASL